MGIERAEQDVGDIERAERPVLEHGGELVAVASPPARRVQTEEEANHGRARQPAVRPSRWRPSSANAASSWSCGWRARRADRGEPVRAAPVDGRERLDEAALLQPSERRVQGARTDRLARRASTSSMIA